MATPLNSEAEIIDALIAKNAMVSEQLENTRSAFEGMMANGQAELEANQKIIDALSPLAQWDKE